MKNNEKSLMEEILGRKKDNSKNELLDNDDTLLNSTVHSLPKTEKLQNNYSQNSETNKNNNKIDELVEYFTPHLATIAMHFRFKSI